MALGLLAATCVAVPVGAAAVRPHAPRPNAIVLENRQQGAAPWAGPQVTDRGIEGYASEIGAVPGDTLHVHVSTSPAAPYRVELYRLGWYGGAGARLVACTPSCTTTHDGASFGAPPPDDNGRVVAGWPVTDTIQVPPDAVSGYYLVKLALASGAWSSTYVIVRQPGSMSRILVQVPVNTWEVYNAWGGKSGYYDLIDRLDRRANRLSFDRPFAWFLAGGQGPPGWETPLVRFLEAAGYDVSYQTDQDTDANPDSLLGHRLVIVIGHSEYWTGAMRGAFDHAAAAGVNLAFMGANDAYSQVRYEDGGRTIVDYKSLYDPNPDPTQKTTMFRELTPPRYECGLIGIQHQGTGLHWGPGDYTVTPDGAAYPWLQQAGFQAGDVVPGIVSVETDTIPGNQTAADSCGHRLTVLFHREHGGDKDGNADSTVYTTPSGSRVFASGSHQFVWGLDDDPADAAEQHGLVDPRLQRFARALLDDLTWAPRRSRRGLIEPR